MSNFEHSFSDLFFPKTIALVGISKKPVTLGKIFLDNLINFGFDKKRIFLINPTTTEAHGMPCYKSLKDVPEPISLVVSLVSRKYILDLMQDVVDLGIKAVIVITAGFREIDEYGRELEFKIGKMANEAGITIVGPNSMGIYNGSNTLNASFTPIPPTPGNVAFLSQSGALGAVMMQFASDVGLGFSKFVSLGNKLNLDEVDALSYLMRDETTDVVMFYLESFSKPREFYRVASKITKKKPVLVVKSGRTARGAKAAVSHTGALASPETIINAALESSGVIRVYTMQDMFDTAHAFSKIPLPKGNRVAIISNAGGPGTITTDAVIENGFNVVDLSEETRNKLESFLPTEASTHNPIDILPSSGPAGYSKSIEILMQDPDIDIIIVIFLPPVVVSFDEMIKEVSSIAKNATKPILGCYLGGVTDLRRFKDIPFPIYDYPETIAKVLSNMRKYTQWINRTHEEIPEIKIHGDINELRSQLSNISGIIPQDLTQKLFSTYGFTLPESRVFAKGNLEQVISFWRSIKSPIVIKMASTILTHKTDKGGVILNLNTEEEIRDAYNRIYSTYDVEKIPETDQNILVQIYLKDGIELAMGSKLDEHFGQTIMIGAGGILIELLKDVQFRLVPINRDDAEQMLDELKIKKLFEGFRGLPVIDKELVYDALLRLSKMLVDFPEIKELDINPVYVTQSHAYIVDARISI